MSCSRMPLFGVSKMKRSTPLCKRPSTTEIPRVNSITTFGRSQRSNSQSSTKALRGITWWWWWQAAAGPHAPGGVTHMVGERTPPLWTHRPSPSTHSPGLCHSRTPGPTPGNLVLSSPVKDATGEGELWGEEDFCPKGQVASSQL